MPSAPRGPGSRRVGRHRRVSYHRRRECHEQRVHHIGLGRGLSGGGGSRRLVAAWGTTWGSSCQRLQRLLRSKPSRETWSPASNGPQGAKRKNRRDVRAPTSPHQPTDRAGPGRHGARYLGGGTARPSACSGRPAYDLAGGHQSPRSSRADQIYPRFRVWKEARGSWHTRCPGRFTPPAERKDQPVVSGKGPHPEPRRRRPIKAGSPRDRRIAVLYARAKRRSAQTERTGSTGCPLR